MPTEKVTLDALLAQSKAIGANLTQDILSLKGTGIQCISLTITSMPSADDATHLMREIRNNTTLTWLIDTGKTE